MLYCLNHLLKAKAMNQKITQEQEDFFTKLANDYGLTTRKPHMSSGRQYFQIYPKQAPQYEGISGTHYEFYIQKNNNNKLYLFLHIEKNTNNRDSLIKVLKMKYSNFISDVTNKSYDQIRSDFKQMIDMYEEKINDFYNKTTQNIGGHNSMQTIPLNQILYGPPGTGKTYHTINKALEIIDGVVQNQRKDAKKRFDELVQAKQIEFVTFHQSYGYEEFVEGIKAIPIGEEGNEDGEEMIYKPMAGVFKKLTKLAKDEFSKTQGIHQSIVKKYKLEAKSLNIQAEMIEDNSNSFRILKGSKIRKGQTPSFDLYTYGELKKKFLQQAKLKEQDEFYILEEDYSFQSMSAASSIVLGRQSNGTTEWKESINDQDLFTVSKIHEKKDIQNYILIIDEINRGNISKIFGELITLIEPSKRIGEEESLHVKLPYSGESFGVPTNLFIIGTMNTADRSIALMDTALRRRFEFIEMMPDLSALEDINIEGIDIAKLLEIINKRIEYLYDRDHTIGHAYFMSLKNSPTLDELEHIFKYKIIPLLQEYFYDDWEKIMMVLGQGFIEKIALKATIFDEEFAKNSEHIEDEKFVYSIKPLFDFNAFKR